MHDNMPTTTVVERSVILNTSNVETGSNTPVTPFAETSQGISKDLQGFTGISRELGILRNSKGY